VGTDALARPQAEQSSPKAPSPAKSQNLVKPPEAAFSRQTTDSTGKINLEKWRTYPFQYAILITLQ
jgi:hypothetical protein